MIFDVLSGNYLPKKVILDGFILQMKQDEKGKFKLPKMGEMPQQRKCRKTHGHKRCPRCGRKVSHLVEKFRGRWADIYRCEGGHLYIKPIPEKELKKENELQNVVENIFEKYKSLGEFLEDLREDKLKDIKISEEWISKIKEIIEKSKKEKIFTLKAEITLQSYEADGIKKIKDALMELENQTNGKVKYISAPTYLLVLQTKNPKKDEKRLTKILESFSKKYNAEFKMVS